MRGCRRHHRNLTWLVLNKKISDKQPHRADKYQKAEDLNCVCISLCIYCSCTPFVCSKLSFYMQLRVITTCLLLSLTEVAVNFPRVCNIVTTGLLLFTTLCFIISSVHFYVSTPSKCHGLLFYKSFVLEFQFSLLGPCSCRPFSDLRANLLVLCVISMCGIICTDMIACKLGRMRRII